jgi:hypothetical protein
VGQVDGLLDRLRPTLLDGGRNPEMVQDMRRRVHPLSSYKFILFA